MRNLLLRTSAKERAGGGVSGYETTHWTSASDMKSLRYHIRTVDNLDLRAVDPKKADLQGPELKLIPLDQSQVSHDLTP